jgi:hypothetical protein
MSMQQKAMPDGGGIMMNPQAEGVQGPVSSATRFPSGENPKHPNFSQPTTTTEL